MKDVPLTPARLAILAEFTHHRWAIPLISECAAAPDGVGGWKYVSFLHRLGISRDSLGRTLAALIAQGWMTHNSGVGHALRPEYVLTADGHRIAPACERVMHALLQAKAQEIGLSKWTLPIAVALWSGAKRFGELRGLLEGASPRAISLAVRDMEEAGLSARSADVANPQVWMYQATRQGLRLGLAAHELVAEIGLRLPGNTDDSTGPRSSSKMASNG